MDSNTVIAGNSCVKSFNCLQISNRKRHSVGSFNRLTIPINDYSLFLISHFSFPNHNRCTMSYNGHKYNYTLSSQSSLFSYLSLLLSSKWTENFPEFGHILYNSHLNVRFIHQKARLHIHQVLFSIGCSHNCTHFMKGISQ